MATCLRVLATVNYTLSLTRQLEVGGACNHMVFNDRQTLNNHNK